MRVPVDFQASPRRAELFFAANTSGTDLQPVGGQEDEPVVASTCPIVLVPGDKWGGGSFFVQKNRMASTDSRDSDAANFGTGAGGNALCAFDLCACLTAMCLSALPALSVDADRHASILPAMQPTAGRALCSRALPSCWSAPTGRLWWRWSGTQMQ